MEWGVDFPKGETEWSHIDCAPGREDDVASESSSGCGKRRREHDESTEPEVGSKSKKQKREGIEEFGNQSRDTLNEVEDGDDEEEEEESEIALRLLLYPLQGFHLSHQIGLV